MKPWLKVVLAVLLIFIFLLIFAPNAVSRLL